MVSSYKLIIVSGLISTSLFADSPIDTRTDKIFSWNEIIVEKQATVSEELYYNQNCNKIWTKQMYEFMKRNPNLKDPDKLTPKQTIIVQSCKEIIQQKIVRHCADIWENETKEFLLKNPNIDLNSLNTKKEDWIQNCENELYSFNKKTIQLEPPKKNVSVEKHTSKSVFFIGLSANMTNKQNPQIPREDGLLANIQLGYMNTEKNTWSLSFGTMIHSTPSKSKIDPVTSNLFNIEGNYLWHFPYKFKIGLASTFFFGEKGLLMSTQKVNFLDFF